MAKKKPPAAAPAVDLNPRKRGAPPAWLPDWRDASLYDCGEFMSAWAFQFIRRNPEYWLDWRRFSALPDYNEDGTKTAKWKAYLGDDIQFYHLEPAALTGETWDAYRARVGEPVEYVPLGSWIEQKWGIVYIPDPAKNPAVDDVIIGSQLNRFPPFDGDMDAPTGYSETRMTIIFDVSYPIDEQIAIARDALLSGRQRLQEVSPGTLEKSVYRRERLPQRPWAPILQAYDSAWSGSRDEQIARALYPNREHGSAMKVVQRHLRTAEALVAGEYRAFLQYAYRGV